MKRRCLVVGLDGATFDVIRPLVDEGKLPTIARLMREGVHGDLQSTIPPASVPAWQSFMTGKNPGKHGVFDFLKRTEGDYYGRLITSRDIKGRTLWDILGDAGKQSIVINVTGTYPPKPIKGIVVSGMMTPEGASLTYSTGLGKRLEDAGYVRDVNYGECPDPDRLVSRLREMEESRTRTAIGLMKEHDWDFFMVLLRATDAIQHALWSMAEKISAFYEEIDRLVGQLLAETDDDTFVILMSDHGFGELRKSLQFNTWLHDLGLLNYKKVDIEHTRAARLHEMRKSSRSGRFWRNVLSKVGMTRETILGMARRLRLTGIKNRLPEAVTKRLLSAFLTGLGIDWPNTKVFLSSFFTAETQSIMINLKGREPQGIVERDEYENLRDWVIEQLREVRDPETSGSIVEAVFKAEELYHGPYVSEAPDIVMLLKGEYKASSLLQAEKVIAPLDRIGGSHRLNGVFVAYGPEIARGAGVENAQIVDLAPTILHMMGVPVPEDIDGRVLREIFDRNSDFATSEIRYQEAMPGEKARATRSIQHLRELGRI